MIATITLPETKVEAVDLMDEGLAILRACSMALMAPDPQIDLEEIRYAMNRGIERLEPVRELVNQADAA